MRHAFTTLLLPTLLLTPTLASAAQVVTTADIVDGAVTTPKLADGAVTDAKISGVITAGKLGAHGHVGSDIADGTITDAKIVGPISASKIAGMVGLGNYANVRIVHKGAADGLTSFNSIASALASIGDASATNRYVVWLMPGVYEESFDTKAFVTIKGSGREVTKVTSSADTMIGIRATINVITNDSPIEDLTVENTNPSTAVPVYVGNGLSLSLSDSRILSTVNGWRSFGVYLNVPSSFTIRDCEFQIVSQNGYAVESSYGPTAAAGASSVERTAIYVEGTSAAEAIDVSFGTSPVEIVDSSAVVAGDATSYQKMALRFESAPSVTLRNSSFAVRGAAGISLGIGLDGVLRAANTQAIGPLYHPERMKLVGCYNENFDPLQP